MSSYTWPEKFGFLSGPEKCIGKTIEAVESLRMDYGCTWDRAFAVRFTDGSRAFFVGHSGSGVMNPSLEAVQASEIFTPEEVGKMVAAEMARKQGFKRDQEEKERREYEALKKKYESK